ncbi:MAG: BatA domain-containing protein, partial [Caulobacteraceae bacterium]|nr:BatA domain-containing protein [Caulobacter sp.]
MLGLPLAFTIPFALVALAGLPVLYVLLKVTPPRPQRVPFPPLKLILDLKPKDETPANTPWWLLLLRLTLATLVILAMAGPIWNPISVGTKGKGSLLVALDTSWAAAPTWDARVVAARQRIEAARQASRTVAVAASSDGGKDIVPTDATTALEHLHALAPAPYTPDRAPFAEAVKRFVDAHPDTTIVWLSDGLERGGARAFAEELAALPAKTILISDDRPVLALTDPRNDSDRLAVRVLRSSPAEAGAHGTVRGLDMKGLTVGEATYAFGKSDATDASFDMPIELRNQIARLEIVGARSAGAVNLLDARWKRRSVGIVSGDTADTAQPLLAPAYYLRKALNPFADVHEPKPGTPDPIGAMLDDHVNVLILADYGTITGPIRQRLSDWVDNGGLLVRFAGTRLSGATDDLVPVKLRRGGRVLGGTLSWERPKHLAAFEPPSPFVGLKVPQEVTINRQVLAEPEPGLPAKTWAQLSDGTPLVTAAARGKGRVVLFHVTADTTWSNLPISGLFVDMLKKVVALSGESARAVSDTEAKAAQASRTVETVAPTRTLDGFGTLGAPP